MATLGLQMRLRRPADLGVSPGTSTINRRGGALLRRVLSILRGAAADANSDSEYCLQYSATDPSVASGGVAISSGSGTVGVTINGVACTATWATSDTNSAGLVAAAINASTNALVAGLVSATNLGATITCSTVVAGDWVDVCGTRFTAAAGLPVEIHSGQNLNTFDCSTSDTATATSLAAKINAAPGVSRYVYAKSAAGVVYVFARQSVFSGTVTFSWPTGQVPTNVLTSSGSTIALSGAALAAGANVGICAAAEGVAGNQCTIAASGTGVTTLGSAARLTGGTGLAVLSIVDDG